MTQNQIRFADEYVISGNGADAYKKAYKNVTKDSTARANASRLLTNANVKKYIEERNKVLDAKKVADMQEVHEFWANVLRDEGNAISERIKASELIGRTNGAFLDKEMRDVRIDHIQAQIKEIEAKIDGTYGADTTSNHTVQIISSIPNPIGGTDE